MTCTRDCCDEHADCIEEMTFASPEPEHVHGRCLHRHRIPVYAQPTGEHVADICDHCDRQITPRTETPCTRDH